jgi:hypothetical protein
MLQCDKFLASVTPQTGEHFEILTILMLIIQAFWNMRGRIKLPFASEDKCNAVLRNVWVCLPRGSE